MPWYFAVLKISQTARLAARQRIGRSQDRQSRSVGERADGHGTPVLDVIRALIAARTGIGRGLMPGRPENTKRERLIKR
jgi:hypothetical protein